MKAAIYVEGQTEATYIRNTLAAYYGHGSVDVEILHLSARKRTPYSLQCPKAKHHFYILIAPGDGSVLSSLRERYKGHLGQDYDLVVGLRDMYGQHYTSRSNTFDRTLVSEIIKETETHVPNTHPGKVLFRYAVMETETWILSMPELIEGLLGDSVKVGKVKRAVGIDLSSDILEEFFHPTKILKDIFNLASKKYTKTESNVEGLTSGLSKELIVRQLSLAQTPSYKEFFDLVLK